MPMAKTAQLSRIRSLMQDLDTASQRISSRSLQRCCLADNRATRRSGRRKITFDFSHLSPTAYRKAVCRHFYFPMLRADTFTCHDVTVNLSAKSALHRAGAVKSADKIAFLYGWQEAHRTDTGTSVYRPVSAACAAKRTQAHPPLWDIGVLP